MRDDASFYDYKPIMTKDALKPDQYWMQMALDLAQKGRYTTAPNPAVGCVLVKDNQLVGAGWHQKAGQPHAERLALAQAGAQAQGATAYVTLEPCSHYGRTPPCSEGLIEAGVKRVVTAMKDPNPLVSGRGIQQLQQAGIEVEVGCLQAQAEAINPGFIMAMKQKRPFVRLKIATSLDGRTALQNGQSKWITGNLARQEVHKLRALHGAIITGIGTVLADDPSLNVRLPATILEELYLQDEVPHPLRVVLDANLRFPLSAKMLSLPGRTLIMTTQEAVEKAPEISDALIEQGAELIAVSSQGERLHLPAVLGYLLNEEQVQEVMVEAGSVVAGAFVRAGLVDEFHVFMAPALLGDAARPMLHLPLIESMADKIQLEYQSIKRVGEDLYAVLVPAAKSQE